MDSGALRERCGGKTSEIAAQRRFYRDRPHAPSETYDYSEIADLCWWRVEPVEQAAD